jgi:hypothetical protein
VGRSCGCGGNQAGQAIAIDWNPATAPGWSVSNGSLESYLPPQMCLILKNRIFEGSRLASLLGCGFCAFLKEESSGLGGDNLAPTS